MALPDYMILHRIHVPPALDHESGIVHAVQYRRAAAVGELVMSIDGRRWYARYGVGVKANGALAKAGIYQPQVHDGVSIIDAAPEDLWRGSLVSRMDQALRALHRPPSLFEEVTFLHPLQPIPLERGGRTGRPFRAIYRDEEAAKADMTTPWHAKGLAVAQRLKRVLADELLVAIPAARRRWTAYHEFSLLGAQPYNIVLELRDRVVRGRASSEDAARASPALA